MVDGAPGPQRCDLLIDAGAVVTVDPERRVIERGAVAVLDGRIAAVGPRAELKARFLPARTIEARRSAVLPGLIDAHAHAGSTLVRGVGSFLPADHWRNLVEFVSNRASPEWWMLDTALSAVERIKAGTTTSLVMLGAKPRGDNPHIGLGVARAAEAIGVRFIVGMGPSPGPWPREFASWSQGRCCERTMTLDDAFARAEEAIRVGNTTNAGLSRFCLASAILPDSDALDERFQSLMRKLGVGFHAHADAAGIAAAHARDSALLGPQTVLAHGHLDRRAVDILASTDTRVAHCPRADEIALVNERPLLPELIDAGVCVGLGSDASGRDRPHGSMFEDMNLAPRWQWLGMHQFNLIPPGKALEMATIDAARVLGLDDRIGSIEVGKEADLIVVDLSGPHAAPFAMPVQRLTGVARGADVRTVVVGGRVVMENRKVTTVDEAEVLNCAQDEAERFVGLFGLAPLIPGYVPARPDAWN